MIGCIWAESSNGVIGAEGEIPWRYPGDFKRFKRVTTGAVVVMGRKTWLSIKRPLPGRTNIVLSKTLDAKAMPEGVLKIDSASTVVTAQWGLLNDVWFIGGKAIYEAAMPYADVLDVTYVPDVIDETLPDLVRAPFIDEWKWRVAEETTHEDDPRLTRRRYVKVKGVKPR